jgi:ComF family protein
MPSWVDSQIDRLGGLLLPPRCVLCGSKGQLPCLDLCAACEGSLPAAEPVSAASPSPLLRSFAPFAYRPPLDYLVHALKYRGQLAVARVLGSLLGQRVAASGRGAAVDVLVPVPLHPSRHAERGYNQSVEIARWTARSLQCRCDPALASRRRETRPQVGLHGDERRRNVAGAFGAAAAVRGRRVAILDDVMTTGATLAAVGQALLDAGALTVEAWCVGRAAPPKQVNSGQGTKDERP